MFLRKIIVGELQTNCYIVADENSKEALIIDPGAEIEKILQVIEKNHLKPRYIVCTHGHPDHSGEVKKLSEKINAPVYIHEKDAVMLNHPIASALGLEAPASIQFLADGQEIKLGELNFRVLYTPGHSKGGISLYSNKILFSGDTLFAGSIGRMDLPGGSQSDLVHSLKKLLSFSADTKVYPGHGPETSIGDEKKSNPFIEGI